LLVVVGPCCGQIFEATASPSTGVFALILRRFLAFAPFVITLMAHTPPRRSPQRAFTAALLVLSLLLAQWLGITHAIAHSGIATAQSVSASGWEPIEHTQSSAHCAAFDAATLGASLHTSGLAILPVVRCSAAVELPIRGGIVRLTARHFNSRAPPHQA
jgi:hypothetical protein